MSSKSLIILSILIGILLFGTQASNNYSTNYYEYQDQLTYESNKFDGFVINGDKAYTVLVGEAIIILDVSDPMSIQEMGVVSTNITEVTSMYINNNVLYISGPDEGVFIYGINSTGFPSLEYILPVQAYNTVVIGTVLYVTTTSSKVSYYDLSNNYALLGSISINAHDISVDGTYLFVTDYFNGFKVYDVSDPTSPLEIGSASDAHRATKIIVKGNYTYLADGAYGIKVYNITDLSAISLLDYVSGAAYDLVLNGDYAYTRGGYTSSQINVFNLTDVLNLDRLDSYSKDLVDIQNMALDGNILYILDSVVGVNSYDVSTATTFIVKGRYDKTTDYFIDEVVIGDVLYVLSKFDGVLMYNITDPANIHFDSFMSLNDVTTVMVNEGNLVFIGTTNGHLLIYEKTSEASELTLRALYDIGTNTSIQDVCIKDDMAYLIIEDMGLVILDVTDLSAITLKTTFNASETITTGDRIKINGSNVFITDYFDIYVIDVTDVTSPVLLNTINLSNMAYDIAFRGEFLYVSSENRIFSINSTNNFTPSKEIAIEDVGTRLLIQNETLYVLLNPDNSDYSGIMKYEFINATTIMHKSFYYIGNALLSDFYITSNLIAISGFSNGEFILSAVNTEGPITTQTQSVTDTETQTVTETETQTVTETRTSTEIINNTSVITETKTITEQGNTNTLPIAIALSTMLAIGSLSYIIYRRRI